MKEKVENNLYQKEDDIFEISETKNIRNLVIIAGEGNSETDGAMYIDFNKFIKLWW